jgi:hypothetical protein
MTDIDPKLVIDIPADQDGSNYRAHASMARWTAAGIKWEVYSECSTGAVAFHFSTPAEAELAKKISELTAAQAEEYFGAQYGHDRPLGGNPSEVRAIVEQIKARHIVPELKVFTDDDDRLQLQNGGTTITEPKDADWYVVRPTEELLETLTSFFAQIIEQRNAAAPGTFKPEAARRYAETTLLRLCRRLDLKEMFLIDLEIYVEQTVAEITTS